MNSQHCSLSVRKRSPHVWLMLAMLGCVDGTAPVARDLSMDGHRSLETNSAIRSVVYVTPYSQGPGPHAVTVLDLRSGTISKPSIGPMTGRYPLGIEVSPDGRTGVVAFWIVPGNLFVLDLATRAVIDSIPVGGGAFDPTFFPDGRRLLVTHGDVVSLVDLSAGRVVKSLDLGTYARATAISADGQTAYAVTAGELAVLDMSTFSRIGTIPIGAGVNNIAIGPDGVHAVVSGGLSVAVVDLTARRVVASLPFCCNSDQIAITPDGSRAYVASGAGVLVIDLASNAPVGEPIPVCTNNIAIAPNGLYAYAPDCYGDGVHVIDLRLNRVTGHLAVPGGAWDIAIGPDLYEAVPTWHMEAFRPLPGQKWSAAYGINTAGTMVGASDWQAELSNPPYFSLAAAVLYKNGQTYNLAEQLLLHGPVDVPYISVARDINDGETVVGWARFENDYEVLYAWNAATGPIAILAEGDAYPTSASAINNAGTVVGFHGHPSVPFKWTSSGGVVDMHPGEPWENVVALDISESGDIVGCAEHAFLPRVGLVYWPAATGSFTDTGLHCPLAFSDWYDEFAAPGAGINGNLTIAGTTGIGRAAVGWKWRKGAVHPVGFNPGVATDISDHGRLVGWKNTAGGGSWAYTQRFIGAVPLPQPNQSTSSKAYQVNACGDVAGIALTAGGQPRAMRWSISACDP